MLHVDCSTKGGVGKSTLAVLTGCVLAQKGKKFKIIELDDNNDSYKYSKSDIFNEENIKTLKLKKKDEALSDMLFDLMSDANMDYIIDIGGGNDTFEVLDAIKSMEIEKTYYIPLTRIKKYMKNSEDTFKYIDDPQNTLFVLNQYSSLENLKDEFLYFFGNKKSGVKTASDFFIDSNFIAIPFTNFIQIAEDDEMSIYDLASISQTLGEDEARKLFFEKAAGDRSKFHKFMTQYWNSQKAAKALDEITQNFWNLNQ